MASKKELEQRIKELETIVKTLNTQIKEDTYEVDYGYAYIFGCNNQEPTIKSKVDAIIKHLGLEITIKNAKEQEIVAKPKKVKKQWTSTQ